MAHVHNLVPQEVETGGSRTEGHPQLHSIQVNKVHLFHDIASQKWRRRKRRKEEREGRMEGKKEGKKEARKKRNKIDAPD